MLRLPLRSGNVFAFVWPALIGLPRFSSSLAGSRFRLKAGSKLHEWTGPLAPSVLSFSVTFSTWTAPLLIFFAARGSGVRGGSCGGDLPSSCRACRFLILLSRRRMRDSFLSFFRRPSPFKIFRASQVANLVAMSWLNWSRIMRVNRLTLNAITMKGTMMAADIPTV